MTQYAAVWARAAEEVLPALGALEPLRQTPHLKYKIVFSVVVVSLNMPLFTGKSHALQWVIIFGLMTHARERHCTVLIIKQQLLRKRGLTLPQKTYFDSQHGYR